MPTREADKSALLAFFRLLGGSTWLRADNWSPDGKTDPCQTRWFGVGCIDPCEPLLDGPHCFFGRVTSITR